MHESAGALYLLYALFGPLYFFPVNEEGRMTQALSDWDFGSGSGQRLCKRAFGTSMN